MMMRLNKVSSILIALAALVAMVLLSGLIASVGIYLAGDMQAFQNSLRNAGGWLLVWRWLPYVGIGIYWWRYARARVLVRILETAEYPMETRSRLQRLECLVVIFVVVFEALNLLRWLGGA